MRPTLFALALLALSAPPLTAQLPDAELEARIRTAEVDPTPSHLLTAAAAAVMLGDYDSAREHHDAAWDASGPVFNGLINSAIVLELASGGGVVGAQRAFREMREWFNIPPIGISNVAGNYPELLASGEFDDMMLRMSPDADDPDYRCGCYNTVAWVHRIAGRDDEAEAIWSTLADQQFEAVDNAQNPNAEADLRGQLARNLARAGRDVEARRELEKSMSLDVSDAALPTVRRRWAQTFAELGDVAGAVEQLEPLLEANSAVTVHTLESRMAWMHVRNDPAFRAMLDRHR